MDYFLRVCSRLNVSSTLKIGPSYSATSNIYVNSEGTGRISHSVSVERQADIPVIQFQQL